MEGIALVALIILGGGLAWCRFVPKERDRMRHVFLGWVAMVGIAIVLHILHYFYPDLY